MSDIQVELSMEDVAYILGVGRTTIYYQQQRGNYPPGAGIELARAVIRQEQQRIDGMRERLSEKVAARLVVT